MWNRMVDLLLFVLFVVGVLAGLGLAGMWCADHFLDGNND